MNRWLLLGIDELLDTRLGTMALLNPEAAKVLVRGNAYLDRIHTDWERLTGGLVTNDEFNAAYAKRGGENTQKTIGASFESGLYPFVMTLLSDDNLNVQHGLVKAPLGLAINIYPYDFDLQTKDFFKDMMQAKFGQTTAIRLVSYAPEDLSVALIGEQFGGMIIYDFHLWIKIHYEEIARTLRNDINIVYPKICETDPGQLSVDQLQHEFMRFRTEHLVNLDLDCIDAKYFSIIDLRKNKDNRPEWMIEEENESDFPLIPERA